MNPFEILKIPHTSDKMAIRRAYVSQIKQNHPDSGGDREAYDRIQTAYHQLINSQETYDAIYTEIRLSLQDLMQGCVATAAITTKNGIEVIEFNVPPMTYPGDQLEFCQLIGSTTLKIRVKLFEIKSNKYTRLDSNIVCDKSINRSEAKNGISLDIENFDGHIHTVSVSPNTTANKLIYNFPQCGFFDRSTKEIGDLVVIIKVT